MNRLVRNYEIDWKVYGTVCIAARSYVEAEEIFLNYGAVSGLMQDSRYIDDPEQLDIRILPDG